MLDSRLLHKTVSHLKPKVNWLDGPLNDWKLHGLNEELNLERITSSIDNHFKAGPIYLVNERTNSKAYTREELNNAVLKVIGKYDFTIWNIALDRVIEFNKIGVFRLGKSEHISQDKQETISYFESMSSNFPQIKNELEEEDLDMVFSKMEIFATYSNNQINKGDTDELTRCFNFQETEYSSMNFLLLNALSVSYCEALLLGDNRFEMANIKVTMPQKLKAHYLEYEKYYNDLCSRPSN